MSATKYKIGGKPIGTEWRVFRVDGGWLVTRRDHTSEGILERETHLLDDAAIEEIGAIAALAGWRVIGGGHV